MKECSPRGLWIWEFEGSLGLCCEYAEGVHTNYRGALLFPFVHIVYSLYSVTCPVRVSLSYTFRGSDRKERDSPGVERDGKGKGAHPFVRLQ